MARSDLLTLAEFLAELGDDDGHPLPKSTFYDWRAKNRAPQCIKLPNGQIRIRRSEADRWLAAHEEG